MSANRRTVVQMGSRRRGNDILAVACAFLLAVLALVAPAQAQTFPALTGRVVDAANIIPDDQEAALTAKLDSLEKESSRQLVVATVPSLEGYDIADYGYRLGRAWGIGQKGQNNGAILLIAPNERKVRIEVGYGLEPILTDAFSSVIINTQIVPAFKAGDFPGGINAGADAIIAQLKLPPEEAAKYAAQLASQTAKSNKGDSASSAVFWLFIFFFFILPLFRSIFGRSRGRRFGVGPVIMWGSGMGGGWGGGSSGGGFGGGGGFSGGGGSFGGGGASGGW